LRAPRTVRLRSRVPAPGSGPGQIWHRNCTPSFSGSGPSSQPTTPDSIRRVRAAGRGRNRVGESPGPGAPGVHSLRQWEDGASTLLRRRCPRSRRRPPRPGRHRAAIPARAVPREV
jgi:hypothetical protein